MNLSKPEMQQLRNIEVKEEEITVLQATITEVKNVESKLILKVLTDYLGKAPTERDILNCKKSTTNNKGCYHLWHNERKLGLVRGYTTENGNVRFQFTPIENK